MIVTEPGRGTFVAAAAASAATQPIDAGWQTVALQGRAVDTEDLMRQVALPDSGAIVLSTGYLDPSLQPTRAMADALARAARRPGVWNRAPLAGLAELRAKLATGIGVSPADVLIVPGGQAGLSTALRALTPIGGTVVVDSPTYFGLFALARSAGLRPVPVATDSAGIRPDLLAETLAMTGARLVCCQPMYANPTGTVLAASRRREVLDVVHDAGAFLLEDDRARQLSCRPDPPPSLIRDDRHGNVVHLMSLTKPAAPGCGSERSRRAGPRPRGCGACASSMTSSCRGHCRRRRSTCSHQPPGRGTCRGCAVRGVLVTAGTPYYAGEPPAPHLRLTYCAEDEPTLTRGIRVLGNVLDDMTGLTDR